MKFLRVLHLLLLFSLSAQADSLDSVLTSEQAARSLKNTTGPSWSDPNTLDRWTDAQTNYGRLFRNFGNNTEVFGWMFGSTPGFKLARQYLERGPEYLVANAEFKNSQKKDLYVRLLVPFPKYASMVEYGLVQAFNQIEPPGLVVDAADALVIKGYDSKLFHQHSGGCSLVTKLVRNSALEVSAKSCEQMRDIVNLAEMIDIKRLEIKLNS